MNVFTDVKTDVGFKYGMVNYIVHDFCYDVCAGKTISPLNNPVKSG